MKVAINGLGRIGRLVLRIGLEKGLNIVAINDLTDIDTLVYLLKHDSVYGNYEKNVTAGKDYIKIGWRKIKVLSIPEPSEIPWKDLGVDTVVECTGRFKTHNACEKHLEAGAKKVIISAPSKDPDITVVYGVNHKNITRKHEIISNASCTTNCLAPVVKVLHENFGLRKGFMTTVHGYTSSQGIVDSPHKKLRRGRAAAQNIVPTSSGATTATAEVIPEVAGRLDGLALRVPVICGSIVDFVGHLNETVTADMINEAFIKASQKELKGVLSVTDEEVVSTDILGNPYSSIVDLLSTQVIGGHLVKVLSWYDNEYGYSSRMVDLIKYVK